MVANNSRLEGTGKLLTLVYNPVGPNLPPDQATLEAGYQRELDARFGIKFNRLFYAYQFASQPVSGIPYSHRRLRL